MKVSRILLFCLVVASMMALAACQRQADMAGQAAKPKTGTLSANSTPAGAKVYVDGAYKGLSPVTVTYLLQGNHVLNMSKPGYRDYVQNVYIYAGKTTYVNAVLTPSPNVTTTGSYYITSNPTQASTYVDNIYKGLTPITVSNMSAGTHAIKLVKSGYADWTSSNYTIVAGQTTNVAATLAALPNATTGSYYIASMPANASTYVDNVYKGLTPITVTNQSVGTHNIKLVKQGYYNWSSSNYSIVAGQTTYVTANLTPAGGSSENN